MEFCTFATMKDERPKPALEVWQRGPVDGVPPLLQPVAHALLQSVEDVSGYIQDMEPEHLWVRPAGMASVGFHIQHMAGVIDRLFTYAAENVLDAAQLEYLKQEGTSSPGLELPEELLAHLEKVVSEAVDFLRTTEVETLSEPRFIGRKRIPTTKIGLLVHAAEHVQRHIGQLLVTVKWVST